MPVTQAITHAPTVWEFIANAASNVASKVGSVALPIASRAAALPGALLHSEPAGRGSTVESLRVGLYRAAVQTGLVPSGTSYEEWEAMQNRSRTAVHGTTGGLAVRGSAAGTATGAYALGTMLSKKNKKKSKDSSNEGAAQPATAAETAVAASTPNPVQPENDKDKKNDEQKAEEKNKEAEAKKLQEQAKQDQILNYEKLPWNKRWLRLWEGSPTNPSSGPSNAPRYFRNGLRLAAYKDLAGGGIDLLFNGALIADLPDDVDYTWQSPAFRFVTFPERALYKIGSRFYRRGRSDYEAPKDTTIVDVTTVPNGSTAAPATSTASPTLFRGVPISDLDSATYELFVDSIEKARQDSINGAYTRQNQ